MSTTMLRLRLLGTAGGMIRAYAVDRQTELLIPADAAIDHGPMAEFYAAHNQPLPPRYAGCHRVELPDDVYRQVMQPIWDEERRAREARML